MKSILKSSSLESGMVESVQHPRKIVFWGEITLFEFPNLLGDNPAVSSGAPLTIGWNHETVNVVTIEYYEFLRQKTPRRRRKEMMLSGSQRDTYLLGLGYSLEQLIAVAEEIRMIQKSRQAQIKSMKTWNKFKQVFEGATRSLRFGGTQPKILAAKCG